LRQKFCFINFPVVEIFTQFLAVQYLQKSFFFLSFQLKGPSLQIRFA
jgi:hypothetical protein